MKKILYIIFTLLIIVDTHANDDVYITVTGNSFSEARNIASKLSSSQGMKIVGQNYIVDQNKKWHVIFQLRSRY